MDGNRTLMGETGGVTESPMLGMSTAKGEGKGDSSSSSSSSRRVSTWMSVRTVTWMVGKPGWVRWRTRR